MANVYSKSRRPLLLKAITGELSISSVILLILAFPYYRSLDHRTLRPIENLRSSRNIREIKQNLDIWITGKQNEFSFVGTAATVSTAITVTVFSWPSIPNTLWYAQGCFYATLVLAISALIAVSQESVVLDDMRQSYTSAFPIVPVTGLEDPSRDLPCRFIDLGRTLSFLLVQLDKKSLFEETFSAEDLLQRMQKSKQSKLMVFLWQRPLMLMSYSWLFLVVGLTLHVLNPFIMRQPFGDDSKIAIMFAIFAVPCAFLFFLSPFFAAIRLPGLSSADATPLAHPKLSGYKLDAPKIEEA